MIEMINAQAEQFFGWSRAGDLWPEPVEVLVPQRFRSLHPGLRRSFFNTTRNRDPWAEDATSPA